MRYLGVSLRSPAPFTLRVKATVCVICPVSLHLQVILESSDLVLELGLLSRQLSTDFFLDGLQLVSA